MVWKIQRFLKSGLIVLGDLLVCEIHENDFNIDLIFQVTYLFVKYIKVIWTLVSFSSWPTSLWNT
jgi:hypothetical protein